MLRSGLRPLVVVCLVATVAPASALADGVEDQAIARSLAGDGLEALKKGDFKTAEDRFRRAEQLFPDPPTITLGLARSLKGQKRFVAAQEAYNRIVRRGKRPGDSAAFEKAVDDAIAEKDEIAKLIGSLTINVKGAEKPVVTLDGAPVNAATLGVRRPIDPGQHEIKVAAPGKLDARRVVSIAEAGSTSVDIELFADPKAAAAAVSAAAPAIAPTATEPPKPPTPPTTPAPLAASAKAPEPARTTDSSSAFSSPWFWTSLGVTAAGAGLAFYGYSQANSIKDDCASAPNQRLCADRNGYSTAASMNMIGYAVAGVGAVGALTVALWPSDPSPKGMRVQPLVGLTGDVGVRIDY